jgi:Spy/CpxP family protein refolding chaperone
MKRSTKIITAVALTLGIAGGSVAYAKHRMGDPAKRADFMVSYIAGELDLDSTQKQALDVLKDQLLSARETMKGEVKGVHQQASELIAAETFDQARALELINGKTAAVNGVAPDVINALGGFLDTLDAEQKAEIAEFVAEHKGRHGRRHHRRHHRDADQ